MEKMDGKSFDGVQENIKKLKKLFPECVNENKINFQKLKLLLGEEAVEDGERYEFIWHGKSKAIKLAQTPTTATLRPDKSSSNNWQTTENIYIEGDNLESLKLLQKAYFGKIKMIYIDPPYNTGNDFVYKDDYRDNISNYKKIIGQENKENGDMSGRFHTNWLNMMYPRLKAARNLLRDDGIIFISIDDNELCNLKKICDEIYGESHFAGQFIIQTNKGGQDYNDIAKTHEYLLCYYKSDKAKLNLLPKADLKSFKYEDGEGKYELRELRNRNPKFHAKNRPNLFYPIYVDPEAEDIYGCCAVSLIKRENYIEVFPFNKEGKESCWRWGKERLEKNIVPGSPEKSNVVAKKKRNGGWNIYEKNRKTWTKVKSIWDEPEVRTEQGTIELRELFGSSVFDHPKPVELIKKLLLIGSGPDDLILDFYSGSATTAQAVMELNAEDGGKRKFILIQMPEHVKKGTDAFEAGYKTICDIGKERIRKAGAKILKETGKNDLDTGFKVFKLDSSNLKQWDSKAENVEQYLLDMQNNLKADRTNEDLIYEILLKIGLPLTESIEEIKSGEKTIYKVGGGLAFICLEDEIDSELIDNLLTYKPNDLSPKIIFKDAGFVDDAAKMNAIQTLHENGLNDVRSV